MSDRMWKYGTNTVSVGGKVKERRILVHCKCGRRFEHLLTGNDMGEHVSCPSRSTTESVFRL